MYFEDNVEDLVLLKYDTSLAKYLDAKYLSYLFGYLCGGKLRCGVVRVVELDFEYVRNVLNYYLDVEVVEFGLKKKCKCNDKREIGLDLRVNNKFKKGNFKKKFGG